MSNRNNVIVERRLRPIYDALDLSNNKKAAHEADKLLRKQPDLLCAKVLKSLALLRQGKDKECEVILESVRKDNPVDESTLQAMTMTYRELQKPEEICKIYENAVKIQENNEELYTHLFMSYVRVGDYKKQQVVAQKLYKITPKNPYYFWGVMSLFMQAIYADDKNLKEKVILPLAQKMVEKFVADSKIEAEQEVNLYLMILEMQNKHEEGIKLIDGDLGRKVFSYFMFSHRRLELLKKLQLWDQVNVYTKNLLKSDPDAYNLYSAYLESVFKLEERKKSKGDDKEAQEVQPKMDFDSDEDSKPDVSLKSCVEFLRTLRRLKSTRGPYLAPLIMYKMAMERSEGETFQRHMGFAIHDSFRDYYQRFGYKLCCFNDLYDFLPSIKDSKEFFARIDNCIAMEADERKRLSMHLTRAQMERYFDSYHDYDLTKMEALMRGLLERYHEAHRLVINGESDPANRDLFVVLLAHAQYDLFVRTGEWSHLVDAAAILEYAFAVNAGNYHFKLLLVKIYNMLGGTFESMFYFTKLDLKHMQLDSMGYLEVWRMMYTGFHADARSFFVDSVRYFTVNLKDAADQVSFAYKFGSFQKVIEFTQLKEKIIKSYQFQLVKVESAVIDAVMLFDGKDGNLENRRGLFLKFCRGVDELAAIHTDALTDNRDVRVFTSYNGPNGVMNDHWCKVTFQHELQLIRLKSALLECLSSCFQSTLALCDVHFTTRWSNYDGNAATASSDTNGDVPLCSHVILKQSDVVFSKLREIQTIFAQFETNPLIRIPKVIFSGVNDSNVFAYAKCGHFYWPFFKSLVMWMAVFIRYLADDLATTALEQVQSKGCAMDECLDTVVLACEQQLEEYKNASGENAASVRETFDCLALTAELASFTSMAMQSLSMVLKYTGLKQKDKSNFTNKKPQLSLDNNKKELLSSGKKALDDRAKECGRRLSKLWAKIAMVESRKVWGESEERDAITNSMASLKLSPKRSASDEKWFSSVRQKLNTSYAASMHNFKVTLKQKIDCLSSL